MGACGTEAVTVAGSNQTDQNVDAGNPVANKGGTSEVTDANIVDASTIDSDAGGVSDTGVNDTGVSDTFVPPDAQDAGKKKCDPFQDGDFTGSCRWSAPYDDIYGGGAGCIDAWGALMCTVEVSGTWVAGAHCPATHPFNGSLPLGMKCYVPGNADHGCLEAYFYSDYGPTNKAKCEARGGTVIYP